MPGAEVVDVQALQPLRVCLDYHVSATVCRLPYHVSATMCRLPCAGCRVSATVCRDESVDTACNGLPFFSFFSLDLLCGVEVVEMPALEPLRVDDERRI